MSLLIRNLSTVGYGQGFTLHHYRTTDTLDDTQRAGYWHDARDILREGDIVIVNTLSRTAQRQWRGGKLIVLD